MAGAWAHAHMWTCVGCIELRQGLGVLCTHQCRIAPAGTPSFLFCQVSVAPLCFPAMVSNRPQALDRTSKCPGCREGKLRCSERDQPQSLKHAACKPEVVNPRGSKSVPSDQAQAVPDGGLRVTVSSWLLEAAKDQWAVVSVPRCV